MTRFSSQVFLWFLVFLAKAGALETTVKIASLQTKGKNLIVQTTTFSIQKDKFKKYNDQKGQPLSYYEIKSFQLIRPLIEKKMARELYFSLGGRLFEGVTLELTSGKAKKVAQLIQADPDGYLNGEAQSLGAATCKELGKLFNEKLPQEIQKIKVRPDQLQRFRKGKC